MKKEIFGIQSAVLTPMSDDGKSIDQKAFARLLKSQVAMGVHGVVIAGTTGEHSTLTVSERKLLSEIAMDTVKHEVTIIAQVGTPRTSDAIDLARHAVDSGADRIMAVAPYYDRLRWRDLEHFLAQMSEIAEGPIVYYHTPRVTGLDLTEDQLVSLTQSGYISHIKDSAADFTRTMRLMLNPGAPKVIAGSDPAMMALLANGAVGSILGASTFIPEICVQLYDEVCQKKDLSAAQMVWKRLWPILNFLLLSGYVAMTKAGAEIRGMPVGAPREPLLPADENAREELKHLLQLAGIGPLPGV